MTASRKEVIISIQTMPGMERMASCMTVAELKEYLGMIVQTEKEVNLQEELCARMSRGIREYENQINILHNNMRTMEKPVKPSRKGVHENESKEALRKEARQDFIFTLIGSILVALIAYGIGFLDEWGVGICCIAGIVMAIIGAFDSLSSLTSRKKAIEKADAIYQYDMGAYDYKCRQYTELENKNKKRQMQVQQLQAQKFVAEACRQKVETALESSRKNLEKMYAYNIVLPKYRSYVMVCSIYEYLCAGRCTTLEGAYNILELEIRLDKIITRLDDIMKDLSAIQANQYTLYCCLQDSNQKIGTLLQEEGRIADEMQSLSVQGEEMDRRLEQLQKSSELTDYLSECNQQELHCINRMNDLTGNHDNPYGTYFRAQA